MIGVTQDYSIPVMNLAVLKSLRLQLGRRDGLRICHAPTILASHTLQRVVGGGEIRFRNQPDPPQEFPCLSAPNLRPLMQVVCEAARLALAELQGAAFRPIAGQRGGTAWGSPQENAALHEAERLTESLQVQR